MILLPTSPFWKRRENAPYPWVLALGLASIGGLTLGVGAVVGTLIFAPDGLIEHF